MAARMDAAQLEAYQELYAKVAGYKLSHKDRDQKQSVERSFVYGEVLPDSFEALMQHAAPQPGERFVDLGCGVGKAVLLAALQFPFGHLTGVELLPSLARASRSAVTRFNKVLRPTLPAERRKAKIEILQRDLREYDLAKLGTGVAFVHASCFERPLMDALSKKVVEELQPGARVVMVGRYLVTPALALLKASSCEMDWGEATAAVYRRR